MALTRRQSVTIARKRRPLRRRLCADWGKTEHGSNGVGKGAWAAVQVAPHGDAALPPYRSPPYRAKLSTQSLALASALQIPIAIRMRPASRWPSVKWVEL